MDPMLAMLLPKGIVVNSSDIYKEVAAYPVVPPEKIWEYWHVYTTTFRKLIDPTAHRLENFWWHVWGSDRRHLSGQALAKLYEEISTGPTFVHIPGPPNRWEGPLTPRDTPPIDSKGKGVDRGEQERPPSKKGKEKGTKQPSSSSSRPPPPHPILKKSRGPSTSGPRPTARFVSPHDTEEEDATEDVNQDAKEDFKDDPKEEVNGGGKEGEATLEEADAQELSSGSTATSGMEIRRQVVAAQSPAKSGSSKKSAPITKKFVASSPASKRRPALPRRPSSQSSVGSDGGSRDSSTAAGPRYQGSHHSIPPIAEQPMNAAAPSPRSREKAASPAPSQRGQDAALTATAAGKRPMRVSPSLARRASPAAPAAPQVVRGGGTGSSSSTGSASGSGSGSGSGMVVVTGFSQNRPVVVQTPPAAAVAQARSSSDKSAGDRAAPSPLREVHRSEVPRSGSHLGLGIRGGISDASAMMQPPAQVWARSEATTPAAATPPKMKRSRSSHEPQRPRELSIGRAPPQGLLAEATSRTTHVAAQGSLIGTNDELAMPRPGPQGGAGTGVGVIVLTRPSEPDRGPEVGSVPASASSSGYLLRRGLDGELLPSRPSSSSLLGDVGEPGTGPMPLPSRPSASSLLLESRSFTPTQPSTSAVVPLGRSKSQLTLLLEREKARMGDRATKSKG